MSTGPQPSPEPPNPWLARQPILTKDESVVGYELLFRESASDSQFLSDDADSATSNTIDTLNVLGLDAVCDGRLAFINCTQQMLLKDYFLLLPPDKVVIEIQETVSPDEFVRASCQRLKQKRYKIALDNFVPDDPRLALIPFADFIKVDIRKHSPEQNTALAKKFAGPQCCMLAQKVETRIQMLTAEKDGFTLFQGYFFRRPEHMRARHIPECQVDSLRLLQAVSGKEVDFAAVEELIKHNASLCYRLLRYLNSPLLGLSQPVQSIRHAMSLLGERELVRWIRMATTLVMGQERCSDLVLSSLVRARFCELIASRVEHGNADLFLMGMLSIMDAILQLPMGIVVEGLPLDPDTRAELLGAKIGRDTRLTPLYQLMLAREEGNWEVVAVHANKISLPLSCVNRAYNEAMLWAREVTAERPALNKL
ncbi:MAG TPA: HDOD domain-containing protein [Candidatus Acidoferrales bacterium]|nr:HDOD domain-containing protein [Candidatus Acidoferrales bacterium]